MMLLKHDSSRRRTPSPRRTTHAIAVKRPPRPRTKRGQSCGDDDAVGVMGSAVRIQILLTPRRTRSRTRRVRDRKRAIFRRPAALNRSFRRSNPMPEASKYIHILPARVGLWPMSAASAISAAGLFRLAVRRTDKVLLGWRPGFWQVRIIAPVQTFAAFMRIYSCITGGLRPSQGHKS